MSSFWQGIISLCLIFATMTLSNPVPSPPVNTMGTANTQCTLHAPDGGNLTISRMKALACLIDTTLLEPMKTLDIPSFDAFIPSNKQNPTQYQNQLQECQCTNPSPYTNIYNSQPVYGIDPHITIHNFYNPGVSDPSQVQYGLRQYTPESIVTASGHGSPVTTEWLLADHINSLKGFVSYILSDSNTNNGGTEVGEEELKGIAKKLNDTIVTWLSNFEFSNACPHDERAPTFAGTFPNHTCEFKCAVWHFNWTLNGLYHALGNQVIYPPIPPSDDTPSNQAYPKWREWLTTDCCQAEPLLTINSHEYRNLTCAVEVLSLESYRLFDKLGVQSSTNCNGMPTVTGIKTWKDYMLTSNLFPPTSSWSKNSNLYIYGNHFDAFMKHYSDLVKLHNSPNHLCYGDEVKGKIAKLMEIFDFVLPLTQRWMYDHNCPGCSTCTNPNVTPPNTTPIDGETYCPKSFQELSCLAIDIFNIAESAYLYLDMRSEATPTWSTSCAEMWRVF